MKNRPWRCDRRQQRPGTGHGCWGGTHPVEARGALYWATILSLAAGCYSTHLETTVLPWPAATTEEADLQTKGMLINVFLAKL